MALVVPEELDLDQFHPWWPKVPEDLRNTQARMIITKEGRRAEGFVLGTTWRWAATALQPR